MRRINLSLGKDWSTWALLGILILAFLLRMGWPTLAEFKLDEATVAADALAIAYRGDRPVVGVGSSIRVSNLPLTPYLMAIPLRLWSDPVAAILFVGLLNGLAVLACYALGRAYFGRAVGLLAAFLFAVSPWAALYGRKIWPRDLPLVVLGFFAALLATFVRGRPWALVGAFASMAALIGFQLEGLAFIPMLLIPMLLFRKQVARWPLLVGVLILILAFAPYLLYDARQDWHNVRGFQRYLGETGHFSLDALHYALRLTGSEGIHTMAGGRFQEYIDGLPDLWWLNWLMMGLLALALLYGVFQVVRGPKERRRPIFFLLLWFAVPVALQTRPTTTVQPHYFVLLYPVQFLLTAIFLVDVLSRIPVPNLRLANRSLSLPTLLVAAFMLLWGGWQIAVVGRIFFFMDRYPTTGGHGIPLKYPRMAAQEARRLANPAEIIVLSTGLALEIDETPTVFEALLFNHPHRFADGRWALPVPASPNVVYLLGPIETGDVGTDREPHPLQPLLERLETMDYVQRGPVIALPDGWSYRLFYRDGPDREDVMAGLTRFPEAVPFANGVAFLGAGMPESVSPGEALEVWLAWWVRNLPLPGNSYHFSAQLLDGKGGRPGQHDGAWFPTASWQAGDLVLNRFSIPIPAGLSPGRYRVWGVTYSYPDIVNVPVLDGAGNPSGDGVTLGEVTVSP
jgi:4-amino-4-deoxy-L-arabinose transferase-like glycosyltransferase